MKQTIKVLSLLLLLWTNGFPQSGISGGVSLGIYNSHGDEYIYDRGPLHPVIDLTLGLGEPLTLSGTVGVFFGSITLGGSLSYKIDSLIYPFLGYRVYSPAESHMYGVWHYAEIGLVYLFGKHLLLSGSILYPLNSTYISGFSQNVHAVPFMVRLGVKFFIPLHIPGWHGVPPHIRQIMWKDK